LFNARKIAFNKNKLEQTLREQYRNKIGLILGIIDFFELNYNRDNFYFIR